MEENNNKNQAKFFNVLPESIPGKIIPKPKPKLVTPVANKVGAKILPANHPNLFKIIVVILILLIMGGGVFLAYKLLSKKKSTDTTNNVQTSNDQTQTADVTTSPEWLQKYFGSETCTDLPICGDKSDPDRDGLINVDESNKATDPNNADSDNDGLADGDEVNIFNTDPLISRTYRDGSYNDSQFVQGGYDITTNQPYTADKLVEIKAKIKDKGLHQPTITTLGEVSFVLYDFSDPSNPPLPADLDLSPESKLDRDTQRQSTIKKIGNALIAYQTDKKTFPQGKDFIKMSDEVKNYNTVATNYNDPINQSPYVYNYESTDKNNFILSYYSETQKQLIKYTNKDAEATAKKEGSQVNDDQRRGDLENIRNALVVYAAGQMDPNDPAALNVFPTAQNLEKSLVPKYISSLPKDPVSKINYQYQLGPDATTFTIKAILQAPVAGTTGYMCNQESCQEF